MVSRTSPLVGNYETGEKNTQHLWNPLFNFNANFLVQIQSTPSQAKQRLFKYSQDCLNTAV